MADKKPAKKAKKVSSVKDSQKAVESLKDSLEVNYENMAISDQLEVILTQLDRVGEALDAR